MIVNTISIPKHIVYSVPKKRGKVMENKIYKHYLAIIPRARMGSWSIPMRPKAEWAINSKDMRGRGITVLVKSNYRDKIT